MPRAPLNEFVERMWLVSGGETLRRDRILPNGTIELVINLLQDQVRIDKTMRCAHVQTLSGVVVSGTYSAAIVIDAMQHAAMMGVHFRPAGAFAVLGVPLAEVTDAHADLSALSYLTSADEGGATPDRRPRSIGIRRDSVTGRSG